MNQETCATTTELLPGYVAGELSEVAAEAVAAHLAECSDCRVDAELIGHLHATRPQPRDGLAASVHATLRQGSVGGSSRRWWMAAAATVVLALGTAIVWDRVQDTSGVTMIAEQVDSDFWPGDETLIAGGLAWDDFSDEEIAALLEDLENEA